MNASRNRTPLFLAGLIAALGLGAGAGAAAYAVLSDESTTVVRQVTVADSEPAATADGLSISTIYQRSYKAVVEITAAATQFSGSQSAQGSGFVYDEDGHIVTNQHVVEGASSISVRFWDGSTRAARLLGTDPLHRPRGDRRQRARVVPRAASPRRLEQCRRRRRRRRPGQPLRARGNGDEWHRERAPSPDDRSEQLHDQRLDPDGRGDQPRELRRPARRPARPGHRRQCADRERVGRLRRRRLRNSVEHRALDRLPAHRDRRGRACVPGSRDDRRRGRRRRHQRRGAALLRRRPACARQRARARSTGSRFRVAAT